MIRPVTPAKAGVPRGFEAPDHPNQTPAFAGATAWREAAAGSCPRCGNSTLFAGLVTFAPRCRACGLDFAAFNVGDGPAAFLIFIVGGIVTILAIWLELAVSPPWWLHVLLWLPLTAALTLGGLRLAKAWLLQAEYRRDAREAVARDAP